MSAAELIKRRMLEFMRGGLEAWIKDRVDQPSPGGDDALIAKLELDPADLGFPLAIMRATRVLRATAHERERAFFAAAMAARRGRLTGDEFRSLAETCPPLTPAIEAAFSAHAWTLEPWGEARTISAAEHVARNGIDRRGMRLVAEALERRLDEIERGQ